MPTESLPKFTAPAAKLWEAISGDNRKKLLANVWCGKCQDSVTIKKYSGTVKAGDLLLVGECAVCHGDVARIVECE